MKMRRLILASTVLLLSAFISNAQTGTVDCSQIIKSIILNKDMHYSVSLPPSYSTSNRSYPVLYLLHGMMDNYTGWAVKGEVVRIADEAFNSGDAPEMIIIMPDGLIDAFYINNYDKSVRWEDFFYQEFIPQIEKKFRIQAGRNTRAIAGLSMGGYGSLYHAIKHKDMFSACYAMSAAVLEVEPVKKGDTITGFNGNLNLKLWGPNNDEGLPTNYKEHSVHEMVKAMDPIKPQAGFSMAAEPGLPKIMIDCGDDDFLLQQNVNLVFLMKNKNIPFEFRIRDGGHTFAYWRTALELALPFIGDNFRR
jgi:S-formylglutathione hydrolase FrmB